MNEYRFLQSRELALLTRALGYTHTHTHTSIHAQVLQQTTPTFKIVRLLPWKHINTVSLFTNQILKLFNDLSGNAGDVKTHNECTQGHHCENMISCCWLATHLSMSALEVCMKVPSAHVAALPGAYKCMLTYHHKIPMGNTIVSREPSLERFRILWLAMSLNA